MTINLQDIASSTLERMLAAGFDSSRISVSVSEQDELNIAHNDASLLRSTEDYAVSLTGIMDGRRAESSLHDLDEKAITHEVNELFGRVQHAPQDDSIVWFRFSVIRPIPTSIAFDIGYIYVSHNGPLNSQLRPVRKRSRQFSQLCPS
jgi:hypothetical protein